MDCIHLARTLLSKKAPSRLLTSYSAKKTNIIIYIYQVPDRNAETVPKYTSCWNQNRLIYKPSDLRFLLPNLRDKISITPMIQVFGFHSVPAGRFSNDWKGGRWFFVDGFHRIYTTATKGHSHHICCIKKKHSPQQQQQNKWKRHPGILFWGRLVIQSVMFCGHNMAWDIPSDSHLLRVNASKHQDISLRKTFSPKKSKDRTLPLSSRESFTWITIY